MHMYSFYICILERGFLVGGSVPDTLILIWPVEKEL